MPNDAFLTATEARILVSLARSKDNVLITESILRETGISGSTWAEEQNKLIGIGLIDKKPVRIMSRGNVSRVMSYRLTDKGKLVSTNLLNISRILCSNSAPANVIDSGTGLLVNLEGRDAHNHSNDSSSSLFNERIKDSIEIGLNSFGVNLQKLVRETVEGSLGISWERISEAPEQLLVALRELFGPEGAGTIESIIAANIRHELGLTAITTDRLTLLIPEAKRQMAEMNHEHRPRLADDSASSTSSSPPPSTAHATEGLMLQ